ncbi:MAG TPA: hypothetical protein VHO25_22785 [Polyangiaceae bacterium]|nr:hypothetical protein [Polyangiaceae bacterium]
MTIRLCHTVQAALAGCAALFTASHTVAAPGGWCWESCGGECSQWPSGVEVTMAQMECAIPQGSTWDNAFNYGFQQWKNVRGMQDVLDAGLAWPASDCVMNHSDGWSDYALISAAGLPAGWLGFTDHDFDDGCTFGDEVLIEADVLILNTLDIDYANINESARMTTGSTGLGFGIIMHELGHAYAFGHSSDLGSTSWERFSLMWSPATYPLVGTSSSAPREVSAQNWEAYVGRSLYPEFAEPEVNLMASAQYATSTGTLLETTPSDTIEVCQTESMTIRYHAINRGTTQETFSNKFFLNTSSSAHTANGPYSSPSWSPTLSAMSDTVSTRVVTWGTGVPAGTYFLYHIVDRNDVINEHYEYDNVVRLKRKVKIVAC